MSVPPKSDRDVIPRWRGYQETARLGELDFPSGGDRSWAQRLDGLRRRTEEWERERTLSFATDLVGSAVVLGSTPEAVAAARQVLESGTSSPLARQAASLLIDGPEQGHAPLEPETPRARAEIRRLRQSTRRNDRNAIRWSELARFYTIAGYPRKALRAMRVARALAPADRYVLRCAVRLEVHVRRPDRAAAILGESAAAREDPWLVAAGIGVAALAGESSRLVRVGHRMLSSDSHSDFELTELASALGTLELRDGNVRHARRLFRQALHDPTDNSIAQTQWASRHVPGIEMPSTALEQPQSWEARAWTAAGTGDFRTAVKEAWRWHRDQPFASRPAELGSYYATLEGDFESGVAIVESTLRSNPREFTLLNNLAFCLANVGRADEAEAHLASVSTDGLGAPQRAIYLATRALVAFRLGRFEQGRVLYAHAGEACGDPAVRDVVLENRIREERRINSPFVAELEEQH